MASNRWYNKLPIEILMDAPPAVESRPESRRQTFIVVVKDCEPGNDKKAYEATVLQLLRANGIHEQPKAISNLSCSFTINLLKEESIQLSNSAQINSIDPDQSLTIW